MAKVWNIKVIYDTFNFIVGPLDHWERRQYGPQKRCEPLTQRRSVSTPVSTLNAVAKQLAFILALKGPAADGTDAPQPWGLLCNPVMKIIFFSFFLVGVPVE
jgi:hypothetical protein